MIQTLRQEIENSITLRVNNNSNKGKSTQISQQRRISSNNYSTENVQITKLCKKPPIKNEKSKHDKEKIIKTNHTNKSYTESTNKELIKLPSIPKKALGNNSNLKNKQKLKLLKSPNLIKKTDLVNKKSLKINLSRQEQNIITFTINYNQI